MKKNYLILFFALVLCVFSNAQNINAIGPELQEILKQKDNELIDIQIYFKSKVNSKQLNQKTKRVFDKSIKREIVIGELKAQSQEIKADVMAILEAEKLNGNIEGINNLWIANSVSCKASPDVIYQLSSHPDVEIIGYDKEFQVISPEQMNTEVEMSHSAIRGPAHHLVTINADDVQNQGYTGKNIIVAVLDSGTNTEHVDLKDHLWEGYVNGELVNGWNYIDNSSNITDDYGHGTHCAGIVCGDGTSGTTTGVAPDAMLMTLKVVGQAGGGTFTGMISAVQFAVENHADVISMSLGFKHEQLTTAQKETIRQTFDNALEAGVVTCAAVGNDGTNTGLPWNVDYPAACPAPWLHPDQTLTGGTSGVIAVGADDLIGQSSQGPSTWEDTKYNDYAYNDGANMGLIRPDICAPGNLVVSSNPYINNEYKQMSGTSQATPCVAGVIALMLEKNSALTPAQISQIIEETAANKPESKNNVVGAGRIDALAAINAVEEGERLPYVTLESFTPEIIKPGQTTSVSLTFKNKGKGSCAANSTVTISLNDNPYISISDNNQVLGQMSTGNSKTLNFEIVVDPSTPNGHVATFDVVTTSGNYTWKNNFSIKVSATPNIVFKSVTPGVINVDQDVNINVTMVNDGNADLNAPTQLTLSTLSSDSKYITIVDNKATIEALAAGETGIGTFTIRANNTVPHNYGFDFFLEIFSQSNTVTDYIYEFENDMEGWTSFDAANNKISSNGTATETAITDPWYHSSSAAGRGKASVASYSGKGHLMSSSNENPYYFPHPIDNYLVAPKKITATENSKFSFYVRPNHDAYFAEHFGVAISTTGNTYSTNFTTIAEWTVTEQQAATWTKYTVDLSGYAGNEIYVAIRHFFSQDEWDNSEKGYDFDALCIDNVTFSDVIVNITHTPTYNNDDPNYFQVFAYNMIELPKVEGLTATTEGTSQIALTWNAVDKAKGYNIYCNGQKIVSNTTETSYTHENLTHNTQYCYEVAAVYYGTEFEHSDEACATTQQLARNIVVKDYSPKTIYVGYNDGSISYTLLNDGANHLYSRSYVTVTCNSDYVTFPGTDSYVQISALNPNEEVTKSTSITIDPNIPNNSVLTFNLNVSNTSMSGLNTWEYFTFDLPIQITIKNDPGSPKNLKVKTFTDNSITLGWDAIANATSYNIYRDGEYIGNTSSTTYFDSGLNFSTQYCYAVTSINDNGESDHSEQVCQTTKDEILGIQLKSYELEAGIGKNIELVATLINKDSETTAAGTATLVCDDQYVTIVRGSADFGALAAAGETTVTFIVNLSATIPSNYVLNFDVIAEYEGGGTGGNNNKNYTFDNDLEGWTTMSTDDHSWYHSSKQGDHGYDKSYPGTPSGGGFIFSESYCNKGNKGFDPDHWIVSPEQIVPSDPTSIVFYVSSMSSSNIYADETFGVFVSTTINTDPDAFQEIGSLTLEKSANSLKMASKSFGLGEYEGTKIWVAIRHYGSGENAALAIDDITISDIVTSTTISSTSTFTVTVNPSTNIFAGEGSWSDASRWSKGIVPTSTDDIIINGDATIDSGDITVKSLSINDKVAASLTVNSGVSLTVNGSLTNTNADAFIINDGAQIFQNSDKVAATFRMLIDNPDSWEYDLTSGWQFIASPVKNAPITGFIPEEPINYDLYKYDGTKELEWINYKNHTNDFEKEFQQGHGYLVSYEALTRTDFKGFLNNDKTFTFDNIEAYDNDSHYKNFYLLGNPFSFNMKWNDFVRNDIYDGFAVVDSKDGSYKYMIAANNVEVNVGDGFFVKTTGPEPKLSNDFRKTYSESYESFDITVSNIYGNDNTIVKLNGQEEEGFTKLDNFNKDITEIYVRQDSKHYGIISIDENSEKLNLGFEAKHIGDHTISIKTDGEFEYVTLIDNFSGEEIDMLNERYEFKAYSTVASHDRFTLKFRKKTKEDEGHFAYQSGNELIINTEGTIQIIDIMGRIIHTEVVSGDSRINISNYDKTAYLIRCIGKSKTSTQKIIIK